MNITKLLIIVHLLPFLLVTPKNLSAETESEEQKLVRLGGYKLIYTTGTKNECVEREPDTVFKWTFPILLFIRGNWVFEHPQMSILLFNKIRVLSKRMSGPR